MEHSLSDIEFADQALSALKAEPYPVPTGLEARILADFDDVRARARRGLRARLRALSDAIRPGMPIWQPGIALAASLIVGLMTGALLPAPAATATTAGTIRTASADLPPALAMTGDLTLNGDE